jgi:hypothetical protein
MIRLFEEIRDAFPQLSMRLDHNPPNVDLSMEIPEQPGLSFEINLNLQGDELHLNAGAFWLEWFPCTRLLSGAYRIRESYRGGSPIKAELQKPNAGSWQTIGTWHGWTWPFPRRLTEKVLQNVTNTRSPA